MTGTAKNKKANVETWFKFYILEGHAHFYTQVTYYASAEQHCFSAISLTFNT